MIFKKYSERERESNSVKKGTAAAVLSVAAALALGGCGGSSGSSETAETGYLIDSAVSGVEYTCGSKTGITARDGAFSCTDEKVVFKVGALTIGSIDQIPQDQKVLPQDIAGVDRNSTDNPEVLKIARFLQSLDEDDTPANGITISSAIKSSFSDEDNLSNIALNTLQTRVLSTGKTFVAQAAAKAHLEENTPGFEAVYDTTPPAAPTVLGAPSSTTEDSVSVTVNGEAQARIYINGSYSGTDIGSGGSATLSLDTSGDDGDKSFSITLQDSSGNESQALSLTIAKQSVDTTAPDAPTLAQQIDYTNEDTTTVEVQGEAAASVYVEGSDSGVDLNTSGAANVDLDTSYADGQSHSFTFTLQDALGNESGVLELNITKDTTAPSYYMWIEDESVSGSQISGRTLRFDDGALSAEGFSVAADKDGSTSSIVVNDTNISFDYTKGSDLEVLTFSGQDKAGNSFSITQGQKPVKKTGQVKSYDADGNEVNDGSLKDDGYYQTGVEPSYERNATTQIVTDHVTGLMWQDDGNASSVTKPWVTQANYDDGNYSDTSGDTAASYCEQLTLGGYSDWRLPEVKELYDIIDSYGDKFIETFQNADNTSQYWSATSYVFPEALNLAWHIKFDSIYIIERSEKSNTAHVRCVRNRY